MKQSKWVAPALLVGMCFIGAARADVLYQIVNSTADMETFNLKMDNVAINGALAGGIQIVMVRPGDAGDNLPSTYTTVCTDINGSVYLGQTYQYSEPVNFSSQYTGIAPTWGADNASGLSDPTSAAMAIQNAAELFYKYSGGVGLTGLQGSDREKMAALQLAVWEALYDTTSTGNVDLTGTPRFQVTGGDSTAIADAAKLVADMSGNYGRTGQLLYPDPVHASSGINHNGDGEPPQELLLDSVIPVPEPATIIAGALLLLPFGASTVRILRRNRAS
jgi:hypothetical protein